MTPQELSLFAEASTQLQERMKEVLELHKKALTNGSTVVDMAKLCRAVAWARVPLATMDSIATKYRSKLLVPKD